MAATVLLPVGAARATTTVTFPDFSMTTGLTLSADAATATTTDGAVLRLTPAKESKSGSAFGTELIGVQQFTSVFSFRMTNPGGITDCNGRMGADGFTFTVQPVSRSIGSNGGGLGIEAVNPAVSVEFDTFCNDMIDPSSSHVGVDINGSVYSVATANVTPFMNDGNRWYAWVEYNGAKLTVRVSQTPDRPATALLVYAIDIKGTLGTENAYVGFTASTGGGYQNHDILQWTYNDHFDAPDGGDETGVGGGGGTGNGGAGGAGGTTVDSGAAGGQGGGADAGVDAGTVPGKGSSGCGCDTGGGQSYALGSVVVLLAAIAGRRRRSRRISTQ
ncbi:MAG: lectin-like domain-containing protein [Polyangia bacterium]